MRCREGEVACFQAVSAVQSTSQFRWPAAEYLFYEPTEFEAARVVCITSVAIGSCEGQVFCGNVNVCMPDQ